MKNIMALFGITALAFFGMSTAETRTTVISFENLPSGPFFSYGYDMDNDGTDDVVFRTDCVSGLTRADGPNPTPLSKIVFPGLQGKIRPGTNEHEVIVEFLTGAIRSISFDFVVGSASDTYESYVQVYGTGQYDRPVQPRWRSKLACRPLLACRSQCLFLPGGAARWRDRLFVRGG